MDWRRSARCLALAPGLLVRGSLHREQAVGLVAVLGGLVVLRDELGLVVADFLEQGVDRQPLAVAELLDRSGQRQEGIVLLLDPPLELVEPE